MLHNDVKPFSLARQVNDSLLDKKARGDAPREPDLEDKPTLDEAKEVTRWANTFIRLLSPDASLQLDQLEADSKFFRSLSVVLFVCAFACFIYCLSACFGVVVIHFSRAAFCELLCLLLLFLSLWRYANLRWKRTRLSYEFLVALNRTGKLNGVSE
jgi:hypothetical protein